VRGNNSRYYSSLVLGLFLTGLGAPATAEAGLGKLWPFASKKHIKRQVDPLTGRVTEMEEVGRQQAVRIKEMDERTQAGLKMAMSKTEEADAKAIAAGQHASEAETAASKAYTSAGEVERRLNSRLQNVENYRQVRTVQVNFKLNQTGIDGTGRETLDRLAAELKDSKGYLLEVQGFADPTGAKQANLEVSRQRANSVVRYLSEKHEVPLFRMRTLGMGSTKAVKDNQGRFSSRESRRVEVHVLRNDATEMASR
jgi:outer membrane protein OmpA-like peptidoglycan-associated protein